MEAQVVHDVAGGTPRGILKKVWIVNTAFAVVGHYSRKEWAETLSVQVGGPVIMDNGDLGSNPNHDRAWLHLAEQNSDWSVLIEDDAILVDNFSVHMKSALNNIPDTGACSFYTGSGQPNPVRVSVALKTADVFGETWLVSERLLWGVAVAIPTSVVKDVISIAQNSDLPYDERLGVSLKKIGYPIYYTIPSLVDHRDGVSILSTTTKERKAFSFGQPTHWSRRAVKI